MDLNGDGHVDLLSGSYSGEGLDEMAGLFQVLWGEGGGIFKKPQVLKGTDNESLIIKPVVSGTTPQRERICTRPTAVDFDADGDLDLVVGNFEGSYYLFRGEGEGKFSPESEKIMRGDKPLITGQHSDPFFVDWDQDGDLDLVSGSVQGGVVMVENLSGEGKEIVFGGSQPLVNFPFGKAERWIDEAPSPGDSTRVWVEDLNEDGKLDVVMGDRSVVLSAPEGMSRQEAKEGVRKVEAEFNELRKTLLTQPSLDEVKAIQEKLVQMGDKRREFMNEKRTGSVWVYLQK